MAVKKYTNRPDVAMQDDWTYVSGGAGSAPVDPRNVVDSYEADEDYWGDTPSTPAPGQATPTITRSPGSVQVGETLKDGKPVGDGQPGITIDFSGYPVFGGETGGGGGGGTAGVSGGGGGTRYKPAVGRVTTARTTYGEEFPEAPKLAEMDKRRVKALTQKAMAPRLRLLRQALSRALVRSYENPNVRRMIVREALQGYGQGVEEARLGGEKFGLAEERAERDIENKNLMLAYNAALEKYKMSGETVTTSRDVFDPAEMRSISGAPSARGGGGYTSGAGPWGPLRRPQRRSSLV